METNARKSNQKFLVSTFGLLLLIAACSHMAVAQTNTFPNSGNVGVGTTSPASILTVQTTGTDTGGDKYLRIKSTNSFSGLMLDPGQAGDAGWLLLGGYPNAGDFTIREYGVGNYFTIKKSTGNVGVGTTSPSQKVEAYNASGPTYFKATSGSVGTYLGTDGTNSYLQAVAANQKIFISNSAGTALLTADTATGYVGIGKSDPAKPLDVLGDVNASGTITGGSIVAKYQDVAEWVPASHALPAGTVVTLDPTKSNHVEASTHAYDTRVAGVVSAQPGITLGEQSDSKVLVATTGRVKVMVDASSGPIEVGDLLVTSDIRGVAKKSEPLLLGGVPIHRPGALIGKALEPLAKGRGEILVLLSLQ